MTNLVLENAGLTLWPILSLFIFGTACIAMVLWVCRSGSSHLYRQLGQMALDDAGAAPKRPTVGEK